MNRTDVGRSGNGSASRAMDQPSCPPSEAPDPTVVAALVRLGLCAPNEPATFTPLAAFGVATDRRHALCREHDPLLLFRQVFEPLRLPLRRYCAGTSGLDYTGRFAPMLSPT
jgi:hypothetical protein